MFRITSTLKFVLCVNAFRNMNIGRILLRNMFPQCSVICSHNEEFPYQRNNTLHFAHWNCFRYYYYYYYYSYYYYCRHYYSIVIIFQLSLTLFPSINSSVANFMSIFIIAAQRKTCLVQKKCQVDNQRKLLLRSTDGFTVGDGRRSENLGERLEELCLH